MPLIRLVFFVSYGFKKDLTIQDAKSLVSAFHAFLAFLAISQNQTARLLKFIQGTNGTRE